MSDTPPEILKKQYEILASKSIEERFGMQIEMMEEAVERTKELLRKQHPHLPEHEITIEFFKLYYHDDFPEAEMEKIVKWMRDESLK